MTAQPAESPEARAQIEALFEQAFSDGIEVGKSGDDQILAGASAAYAQSAMLAASTARPTEPCGYCGEAPCICDRDDLCQVPGCRNVTDRGICSSCDQWVTGQATARQTERGAVEGPSKEWCLNMARLEGSQEIGAGMPDHPLRAPETATDQAAEVECREALGALVTAAAEYQEAAQQHISDTRYDEDGNLAARDAELSVVALPRARAALATQPATGRTMGGEDGLRKTAEATVRWLDEISTNCDMAEIVADGGITAGMVVQQEAGEQIRRLRAALQNGGE